NPSSGRLSAIWMAPACNSFASSSSPSGLSGLGAEGYPGTPVAHGRLHDPMPTRMAVPLLLGRLHGLRGIQAALVVVRRLVRRDEDRSEFDWQIARVDDLVLLARRHPHGHVFFDRGFDAIVHADTFARDDENQFRTVMGVVIGAPLRGQDGMAEGKLFDALLVWCEQNLDAPLVWCRDLNALFFPSLDELHKQSPCKRLLKPTIHQHRPLCQSKTPGCVWETRD